MQIYRARLSVTSVSISLQKQDKKAVKNNTTFLFVGWNGTCPLTLDSFPIWLFDEKKVDKRAKVLTTFKNHTHTHKHTRNDQNLTSTALKL